MPYETANVFQGVGPPKFWHKSVHADVHGRAARGRGLELANSGENSTQPVEVTMWQVRSRSAPHPSVSLCLRTGFHLPAAFYCRSFVSSCWSPFAPQPTPHPKHMAATQRGGWPSTNGWQELVCKDHISLCPPEG